MDMIFEPEPLLRLASPVNVPVENNIPPAPATPRTNLAQYVALPIAQDEVYPPNG